MECTAMSKIPALHRPRVGRVRGHPHEALAIFESERGERLVVAAGKALDAQFEFGALGSHAVFTTGGIIGNVRACSGMTSRGLISGVGMLSRGRSRS